MITEKLGALNLHSHTIKAKKVARMAILACSVQFCIMNLRTLYANALEYLEKPREETDTNLPEENSSSQKQDLW